MINLNLPQKNHLDQVNKKKMVAQATKKKKINNFKLLQKKKVQLEYLFLNLKKNKFNLNNRIFSGIELDKTLK